MSERSDKGRALLGNGCNCPQAVFIPLADEFGVDETTAMNMARGFGGGMGREGLVCGAVSGAVMALGCMNAETAEMDEDRARFDAYADVAEFHRRFRKIHGEVNCAALIGLSLKDEKDLAEFRDKNILQDRCRNFVADAIEIVEDIL